MGKMNKLLCFDMDGTIADFYNVPDWLEKLQKEDPSPYIDASPLWDMKTLRDVLINLIKVGWEVCVISWLAKNSTKEYDEKVREAKRAWLKKYDFPANKIHLVSYGTIKENCVRHETTSAILIDDNEGVRNDWHLGETIDPTSCNLINELKKILKEE